MFLKLSDENLLSKRLHGKTQNSNESINGVIWKRCSKDVFVGGKVLEMGVASAVISFNDGTKRLIDIMKELMVEPGHYSETYDNYKYFSRVKSKVNKITVETKSRRKRLRAIRKGFADANEAREGLNMVVGNSKKWIFSIIF